MPRVLFPLTAPKLQAAQEQQLGTPAIILGRLPFPGEFQANNTTNLFVNPVLPLPLMFKGVGKLRNRFPVPPFSAPYIDPKPDPVAPLPLPLAMQIGFGKMRVPISKPKFAASVPTVLLLSGVTRTSAGVVLGSCTVNLFRTIDNKFIDSVVSDATTGAYSFTTTGVGQTYFVVAYKAGSPDTSGTSLNTLVGV